MILLYVVLKIIIAFKMFLSHACSELKVISGEAPPRPYFILKILLATLPVSVSWALSAPWGHTSIQQ
jgi:hypothetical protein